jgi:hypothetical protein
MNSTITRQSRYGGIRSEKRNLSKVALIDFKPKQEQNGELGLDSLSL